MATTLLNGSITLPIDVLSCIFCFLSVSNVCKASQVCKIWNTAANHPNCWQSILVCKSIKYQAVEYFRPYVTKQLMTWKEAYRYSNLAILLTRILEKEYSKGFYAQAENPVLESAQIASRVMPQPRVKYGNISYSIFNLDDVKVQKEGELPFEVWAGEKGKMLTHLAVENHRLFALRQDGCIVQYNLLTQGKSLIPTSWTVSSGRQGHFCTQAFYVKDGYIVIKGGDAQQQIFEAIPYNNPEERKIIKGISLARRILVVGKKLYILGKNKIVIWSLSKNKRVRKIKIDMPDGHRTYDLALSKNTLFMTKSNTIHIYPKTGQALKNETRNLYQIVIIENLLFGVTTTPVPAKGNKPPVSFTGILVKNLNTGKTLEYIQNIFNHQIYKIAGKTVKHEQDVFKSSSYEIEPNVLMTLVGICRNHCQKFTPSAHSNSWFSAINWSGIQILKSSPK